MASPLVEPMTNEFLWAVRTQPTRGPKPALTIERITDTAIRIADTEGLASASMQRVAADLGFTKMSLYRYMPGKAELVALMVERAIGHPPTLDADAWPTALKEWSRRLLAGYLRHPWALEATVGPRPLGPHELSWMESALAVLADTGLTGAECLDAIAVLTGHVRMIAQQAGTGPQPGADLLATIAGLLREHGDRFPSLTAAIGSATAADTHDQAFDFGLNRIIDGLHALINQRGRLPTQPA